MMKKKKNEVSFSYNSDKQRLRIFVGTKIAKEITGDNAKTYFKQLMK